MKNLRVPLLLCFLVLGLTAALWAQTDTARIVGTITDNTGAVVPNVTVTVTSRATGRVIATKSDATGNYTVAALPPGNYRIEVKQPQFSTAVADVVVQVSQVQEANFKLSPGNVETTINVTDEVPLIETNTSSTGEVIIGRQVTELPLNGRNFTQLALLTPGVTRGYYGDVSMGGSSGTNAEAFRNSDTGGASISVNGLRQQANNFLLDGVDNNEGMVNSIVFFPPAEAIQEFRVNTSVAPAELGRAGGAIIQTATKSGSNEIHGSAFEFRRSGFASANPYGVKVPPPFKRNQFGGTLGMPIWKNKLFIFGDYQGLRQAQPVGLELATVPTAKMRTGDFSELLGTNLTTVPTCAANNPAYFKPGTFGTPNQQSIGLIFNPATCTPYPGNIITNANTAGLNYLKAFPLPNNSNLILQNFNATRQSIRNYSDFDVRLDWVATQKDALFARYSYGQDGFTVTDRLKDATHDLPSGFGSGDNFNHPRGVAVGSTHTFTTSLINEFRFGYVRPAFGYNPPFEGTPLAANLGIQNANRNSLLGGIALIGGNNNEIEYTGDYGPYVVPQHTYQYTDTLSFNHGKHSFRVGTSIIRRQVKFFQGNAAKGYFILGGVNYPGTGRFTGYEMTELLSGFPDYKIGQASNYYDTRHWETGYYAQDDWRVTNRLTLNLGLRYDFFTWPVEQRNMQSNFDPTTGKLIVAGTTGWPRSLMDNDSNNIAPRIGFAYDLFNNARTVLRGGYGRFFFLDRGGVGNQLSNNADFNGVSTYQACTTQAPVGAPMCPGGYRITFVGQGPLGNNNPAAATAALPPAVSNVSRDNPQNVDVISYPRNNQNSQVDEWNIQIEQAIGTKMVFDAAYVGTHMGNLATAYNANNVSLGAASTSNSVKAFPNLGNVNTYAFIGSGNYNGLQMRLTNRLTRGFQFTSAYTWSHTLDNSVGAFTNSGGQVFLDANHKPLLDLNYGNADNDIRHYFTFGALYELPFGNGKQFAASIPAALDWLIGGWQWNNIITLASGAPFNLSVPGTPGNRPDLTGRYQINPSSHIWLTGQFTAPPRDAGGVFTRPGTVARNFFHGPGLHTWDMSMFKDFRLHERFRAEFRLEAFNLTNTPQFTNPNGDITAGNFGQLTSTRLASEREVQFVVRVQF